MHTFCSFFAIFGLKLKPTLEYEIYVWNAFKKLNHFWNTFDIQGVTAKSAGLYYIAM